MLKIFNTFGVSFHLNYSTLAEIHEKLYIWSELYSFYCILYTYSNIGEISNDALRETKLKGTPKSIQYYKKLASENIILDKSISIVTKLKNLIEPDNLPSHRTIAKKQPRQTNLHWKQRKKEKLTGI